MNSTTSKRLFDLTLAIGLLPPVLLIGVIIAIVIKLDSPGPVFFIQYRLGKNGIPFAMYKFRTMIPNAEHVGSGLFSYENDSRVTRIGRYLRITSLDELPQLMNVLLGTMSIVGPRPPVTYELGNYENLSERTKLRFRVKPGITGRAQISGRNNLSWDEKIELDINYVSAFETTGIVEDLRILLKTARVVLVREGVIERSERNT